MPRLIAALLGASLLSLTPRAHAEPGERNLEPRVRWDLDSRVGYGAAFTTAQSFLGFGTGLALGAGRARGSPHLELGVMHYPGTIVAASNAMFRFWSRSSSTVGHVALGYEVEHGRLALRPELAFGSAFVSTSVRLGPAARHEVDCLALFGFGGATLYRWRGLHAGVVAHAYYVPSRVAAPILDAAGVFGLSR